MSYQTEIELPSPNDSLYGSTEPDKEPLMTKQNSIITDCFNIVQKCNLYLGIMMILSITHVILNIIGLIDKINYNTNNTYVSYWDWCFACTLSMIYDIVLLLIINVKYSVANGTNLCERIESCTNSCSTKRYCIILSLLIIDVIKFFVFGIIAIMYFKHDKIFLDMGDYFSFLITLNFMYHTMILFCIIIFFLMICFFSQNVKTDGFD
jgi:hypothetical protein